MFPHTFAFVLPLQWSPGTEAPIQFVQVSPSTNHSARVWHQFPPRFVTVLRSVRYVPPTRGSLMRAWKAMKATNIQYRDTCWRSKRKRTRAQNRRLRLIRDTALHVCCQTSNLNSIHLCTRDFEYPRS